MDDDTHLWKTFWVCLTIVIVTAIIAWAYVEGPR